MGAPGARACKPINDVMHYGFLIIYYWAIYPISKEKLHTNPGWELPLPYVGSGGYLIGWVVGGGKVQGG